METEITIPKGFIVVTQVETPDTFTAINTRWIQIVQFEKPHAIKAYDTMIETNIKNAEGHEITFNVVDSGPEVLAMIAKAQGAA